MRALGRLAIPLLGLAALVTLTGSASAADCKVYVKANYAKAQCDAKAHEMAMHKAVHHASMHKAVHHKKVVHKKKKKAV